ncbi:MAG TPA: ankyrin repeat domain-containing protein [Bryobacteraceae bacterium]|jgi:ankyrin repeat protein
MIRKILLGSVLGVQLLTSADSGPILADSAQAGDLGGVRTKIQQKADLNRAQADGMTALHWAAANGDLAMTQLLLNAGASPQVETRLGGITPLFLAAKNGNAAVGQALLKAGAKPDAVDGTGATPLMLAANAAASDLMEALLAKGASVNAKENAHGQTALMFAAAANRGDAVSVLMKHGADAEIATSVVDPGCGTLFAKSMGCGGGGDNADAPDSGDNPAATGKKGGGGKGGGRRRGPTVMGGMTALLFAARDGRTDAARALIESGAKIDNPGVGEKMTPLVMAIVNGHYDLAAYFLDRGADPNLANIEGLTALYATVDMQWAPYAYRPQPSASAAEISYLELMKTLLAHGANPNATLGQRPWFRSLPQDRTWVDPAGATAFWRAAQAADVDAMRVLVKAGADPKLANAEGDTSLMVAAGLGWATNFSRNVPGGWFAAVQYCLELGMDVNARSAKGYTPLHGAAFIGDNPLIQFLVGKGADVRAVANDKNTVADMANGPIEHSVLHPDTVAMLEKLGSANSNNCRSDNCFVAAQSGRQGKSKDSAPTGKPDGVP